MSGTCSKKGVVPEMHRKPGRN